MVSNISQHKLTPPYFDALVEFKIRLEKLSSDGIYSRHNGFGVSVRLHSNKQISCDQVLLEGQDLVSTLFFINSDVQDMENSKNTSGLILFCSKLPFSHDLFRQKNINYVLFISIYDGQSLVFREKILLHFDCIHGINAVRPLMCNNIRIISFQISVFARLVCIPLTTNVDLLAFGEKYNISCPTDSNDIHDQLWHAYIFLLLSSKPLKPNPSFSFTNDEFPFINIDFNQIIKNIYFICEILNTIFLSMESFNTNVENHYSQNDNSPIQRNKYTDPIDMLEMQKELEKMKKMTFSKCSKFIVDIFTKFNIKNIIYWKYLSFKLLHENGVQRYLLLEYYKWRAHLMTNYTFVHQYSIDKLLCPYESHGSYNNKIRKSKCFRNFENFPIESTMYDNDKDTQPILFIHQFVKDIPINKKLITKDELYNNSIIKEHRKPKKFRCHSHANIEYTFRNLKRFNIPRNCASLTNIKESCKEIVHDDVKNVIPNSSICIRTSCSCSNLIRKRESFKKSKNLSIKSVQTYPTFNFNKTERKPTKILYRESRFSRENELYRKRFSKNINIISRILSTTSINNKKCVKVDDKICHVLKNFNINDENTIKWLITYSSIICDYVNCNRDCKYHDTNLTLDNFNHFKYCLRVSMRWFLKPLTPDSIPPFPLYYLDSNTFPVKIGEPIHLIVCVHGLEGSSNDLILYRHCLNLALVGYKICFLMSNSNEGNTDQNLILQGTRLADEIIYYSDNFNVEKLSFIGHSMGNLIIRSAINSYKFSHFQHLFHTYISIGGPHLGLNYTGSKLVKAGVWCIQKLLKSYSMSQMTMNDSSDYKETFIYKLSRLNGLTFFKNIILISSPQDYYVPFHSAHIKRTNNMNSKKDCIMMEMISNILTPLIKASVNVERHEIHFVLPNDLFSFIGRSAHIMLANSVILIEKLVFTSMFKYFAD